MRGAVSLLMALGVAAQFLLFHSLRNDLRAVIRDEAGAPAPLGHLLAASPILLALGGSAVALTLHRRGSGWARAAVALPLAVLALGFCVAAYLTVYPLPLLGGDRGLPL